jgi:hypothetical protein
MRPEVVDSTTPESTGRQQVRAGFWIAFDDPKEWLDRRRLEIHVAMVGFNRRKRIAPL